MSKINVNTWEPESGTTITAGATGDTLAISADSVTGLNVGSDAQGDILYHDGTDYTRLGAGTSGHFLKTQGTSANPVWAEAGGNTVFISKQTASSDANLQFTSGFSTDYFAHVFKFDNLAPETNDVDFHFYLSEDSGSSYYTDKMYGVSWRAYNSGAPSGMSMVDAKSPWNAAYGMICWDIGNDVTDEYYPVGSLVIYRAPVTDNTSWRSESVFFEESNVLAQDVCVGVTVGKPNVVNAIKFVFSSGDFAGDIRMYGVKAE
jgi:hypothetical protein